MHPKCGLLFRHSDLFITFHDQGMTWPTPGWASFYTFTVICYLPPRLNLHPAFFPSSTIAGFSIFPPCNPAELLEPTHARAWALITKDCLNFLQQLLLFLFSLYLACHSTSFCKVWLATDCWVNSWVNFLRDSDYPGHRGKLERETVISLDFIKRSLHRYPNIPIGLAVLNVHWSFFRRPCQYPTAPNLKSKATLCKDPTSNQRPTNYFQDTIDVKFHLNCEIVHTE